MAGISILHCTINFPLCFQRCICALSFALLHGWRVLGFLGIINIPPPFLYLRIYLSPLFVTLLKWVLGMVAL